MTVAELIKLLEAMPPDARVMREQHEEGNNWRLDDIEGVAHREKWDMLDGEDKPVAEHVEIY